MGQSSATAGQTLSSNFSQITLATFDEVTVIKRLEPDPHKKILGSWIPLSGHTETKSASGITGLVICEKLLGTIISKHNSKTNRLLIPTFLWGKIHFILRSYFYVFTFQFSCGV